MTHVAKFISCVFHVFHMIFFFAGYLSLRTGDVGPTPQSTTRTYPLFLWKRGECRMLSSRACDGPMSPTRMSDERRPPDPNFSPVRIDLSKSFHKQTTFSLLKLPLFPHNSPATPLLDSPMFVPWLYWSTLVETIELEQLELKPGSTLY